MAHIAGKTCLVVKVLPEGQLVLALVAGDGEARAADAAGAVPQDVGLPVRLHEAGGGLVRLAVHHDVLLQQLVRRGSLGLVLRPGAIITLALFRLEKCSILA